MVCATVIRASASSAIVVGGAGALGRSLVSLLQLNGVTATSVDFVKNKEASKSIAMDANADWTEVGARVTEELNAVHGPLGGVSAVFSVAGGWAGGGVQDPEFLKSVEKMWRMNAQSAALTASIAGETIQHG